MQKLTLKEIQQIELGMLIEFDRYCSEKGIYYSLGAGTMLGAVRHKGFIPWDDDIDLFMTTPEYNKFIKSLPENRIISNYYKVLIPNEEQNYIYPFIKIIDTRTIAYECNVNHRYGLGIWMDIFRLHYVANDENYAEKVCLYRKRIVGKYRYYFFDFKEKNFKRFLSRRYIAFINTFRKARMLKLRKILMSDAADENARYVGTISFTLNKHDAYPREYFDDYIRISFEGHDFSVFAEYDKILSHRYGDYMKLPPIEMRVSHELEAYKIQ